jgi:SAM-dependent methyltransferase
MAAPHPSPPSLQDVFSFGDEVRETRYGHNLVKNERRFHRTLAAVWPLLEPGSRILDLGGFPGTMVELLRHFGADLDLELEVGGLLFESPFTERMGALGVGLREVNLDPVHDGLPVGTPDPTYHLATEAEGFDVVIATEILEHMVHPSHLLLVANEALRPGGHIVLTTPNQAWLRHRFDLLLGRSPNTPLPEGLLSGNTDDWRPHVRLFTMAEVQELLEHEGFRVTHEEFLDMTRRGGSSLLRGLVYAYPPLRHGLLVVARRESEADRWPGSAPGAAPRG